MKKTEQRPFDYQQAQKEATEWFDDHYKEANKELDAVAWARGGANPLLQEYLDNSNPAPTRAIVIGCGLGDDAYALHKAGFDVTAIDISPEAI
ncbi:MAG: class I SAM-dependent methyltransferase, partial [Thiovulaceae bacterium]|nr:class I SAM-dependent methyltransferase [Sulfurimonadaceae bacterium]